ncbi:tripartite tricarboxylate transporter permease [Ruegeria pomeroyi]|nr:tripartite tricarboxylate transporter permease [Ruegeria pomeroyi]NVK96000.1 tripartite tricarboxylate transporter permease [Ruegeria pomeroyi]NVL02744.1 tripartite tricarboxylate transporter permease [Ruegeria pomeroyi]QWV09228.1 tripartite tricarboxylate transporter permease [Ruegeria pomeroyi]HCE71333.1 Tricarboxylate transporter family protein [Ruegeria sp.]
MDALLAGIQNAFALGPLLAIAAGVSIGIFMGAVPGLTAAMAIALLAPITFGMDPLTAVAFLIGIYKGGTFGGSISAILLNVPGSPEATATAFDGYPLSKSGRAKQALQMALFASVCGAILADLMLYAVAGPFSKIALKFGPAELTFVVLFAFTFVAGLTGGSLARGLIACAFGVLCAMVGLDPMSASPRMTFGIVELLDGLPLIPIAIGMLGLAEVMVAAERAFLRRKEVSSDTESSPISATSGPHLSLPEFARHWKTVLRSSLIGSAIGALPGIGASLAAFIGYGTAQKYSKTPEKFGKGTLDGVAAPEAANSAVVGGSFVPLLTLGIPGNVTTALLIGTFLVHGIEPGPHVFKTEPALIYGIFTILFVANFFNLAIGLMGSGLYAHIVKAPEYVSYSIIGLTCMTGVFASTNSIVSLYIMIIFAVIGYLMKKFDYSFVAFLIGFVLAPEFEVSFRSFLLVAQGDPLGLLMTRPIALAFCLLTIVAVLRIVWSEHQRRTRSATSLKNTPDPSSGQKNP